MDPEILKTLVQGGAMSLALVALGMVFYVVRVLLNHLPHITKALHDLVAEVHAMREADQRWRSE